MRALRPFVLSSCLSLSFLALAGCQGTEVELSEDKIDAKAPEPVPIKDAPPSSQPPGGLKNSSGNSGFNPGASS
jgi:hypothetical protein